MINTPHTHANKMALYAQDAAEISEPWIRWEMFKYGKWVPIIGNPVWMEDIEYRQKPAIVCIGEYKVPMPLRSWPRLDDVGWVADPTIGPRMITWCAGKQDRELLKYGFLHSTKEAAQIHVDDILHSQRL